MSLPIDQFTALGAEAGDRRRFALDGDPKHVYRSLVADGLDGLAALAVERLDGRQAVS